MQKPFGNCCDDTEMTATNSAPVYLLGENLQPCRLPRYGVQSYTSPTEQSAKMSNGPKLVSLAQERQVLNYPHFLGDMLPQLSAQDINQESIVPLPPHLPAIFPSVTSLLLPRLMARLSALPLGLPLTEKQSQSRAMPITTPLAPDFTSTMVTAPTNYKCEENLDSTPQTEFL